jgi:hypothetical protein
VVAVGALDRSVDSPDWGGYPVDEVALKHGAGVEQETNDPNEAYAHVSPKRSARTEPLNKEGENLGERRRDELWRRVARGRSGSARRPDVRHTPRAR